MLLGPLKSVIVGHDGLARGAGWYLVSLTVREREEDMDDIASHFKCDRLLCFAIIYFRKFYNEHFVEITVLAFHDLQCVKLQLPMR